MVRSGIAVRGPAGRYLPRQKRLSGLSIAKNSQTDLTLTNRGGNPKSGVDNPSIHSAPHCSCEMMSRRTDGPLSKQVLQAYEVLVAPRQLALSEEGGSWVFAGPAPFPTRPKNMFEFG